MAKDIFRIAVIGAGETGTPLLTQLLDAPFVEILGVADLDAEAPGMRLARERGVATTTDFMDLARLGEAVDVLIDVTGVPKVREALRQHMQDSGNSHTLIVHEMVVQLMLSLLSGRLVQLKHEVEEY
ncbi:oxidoreductase [Azospirillum brasilense]|uniref:Oxidoreductase n=1 Tax=Azospirillum brasilense TaxID=192 RepID=A0A0P0EDB8_AZOBR|nr:MULTISPECIES: oxidoreductase [Azospirillum]ALJ35712.1 oxidoreductase [Azospirillum brasilense]MDW7554978.1 oxidoreductase [Azospirillum brasilense]MDW7594755.1 oxidoreductase [Azospirillum brasilense]MDW7629609.1 oxidoreductase [Azospirillum brasilense]MDX5954469.1 oxidoreductase [Azospirillum brasilense]